MRIVLADPPAHHRRYDNSYPNIGILYVLAYARDALPQDTFEYLESQYDMATHLEYLDRHRPDVYGISFTSKTARLAQETIGDVRRRFPQALIVCGGAHPTAMPEDVLQRTEADVVVIGEGEQTFVDLLRAHRDGLPLDTVPGIAYRSAKGLSRTPCRPPIPDLDSIPFPAWDLIDHRRYPGMHLKKQPIESSLVISRGCPFDCTFCSNPVWKNAKPWLRFRGYDSILQEIKVLYERGVREIYFASDEMNFSLKWAKGLLNRIKSLGFKDLFFQCNLRVDKVDTEFAIALREAGFWLVHVGMESGNDRVLTGLEKKITVEQIISSTSILADHGVKIFGFMMLYNVWEKDGELCFETTEEVDRSLELCRRLLERKHIHYMSWQFSTPMPGSKLYEIARRHRLFLRDEVDVWEGFDEHGVAMRLPGIGRKEMVGRIRRGVIMKDWFMLRSGNISLRHLWRVKENLAAIVRRG